MTSAYLLSISDPDDVDHDTYRAPVEVVEFTHSATGIESVRVVELVTGDTYWVSDDDLDRLTVDHGPRPHFFDVNESRARVERMSALIADHAGPDGDADHEAIALATIVLAEANGHLRVAELVRDLDAAGVDPRPRLTELAVEPVDRGSPYAATSIRESHAKGVREAVAYYLGGQPA